MRGLLDLFSLAEACLIADVTQLFVDRGVSFNPTSVAEDVRNSIEFVHRSGNMHNAVIADPETYLHRYGDILAFQLCGWCLTGYGPLQNPAAGQCIGALAPVRT